MWRHRRGQDGRRLTLPGPRRLEEMRGVLRELVQFLPAHPACHGFTRGRSVETALLPHVGHRYYAHLDLVQFFRSTTRLQVIDGLMGLGCSMRTCQEIVNLCFEDAGLPVGAPTSPALANVACWSLDCHANLYPIYTRYADNLLWSSDSPIDEGIIRRLVNSFGYRVNERKSWLRVRGRHQLLLFGYVIGENGLSLSQAARRRQRAEAHAAEREL
jgi:RNA-directed DNA polymerase